MKEYGPMSCYGGKTPLKIRDDTELNNFIKLHS